MEFTARSISFFIVGALSLILGSFVFWQYRKRRAARFFSIITFLCVAYIWLVGGLASARSQEMAQLWVRVLMPAVYFLIAGFYHFSMVFSRTENRWTKGYLHFAYLFAGILSLVKILNLAPATLDFREGEGWFPSQDFVYFKIYMPFVDVSVFGGLGLVVYRIVKTRSAVQRNQLWFYFLAIAGAVLLSQANMIPQISFLAPFSPLVYFGLMTYAITRHRLFDLSLVMQRGVIAVFAAFTVSCLAMAGLLKVQHYLIIQETGFTLFAIASTALLLSLLFLPIWSTATKYANRWLGVKVLNPTERLLEFSSMQANYARFEEFLSALLKKLCDEMGLNQASLYFKDRITGRFMTWASFPPAVSHSQALAVDSVLAAALDTNRESLDLEEMLSPMDEGVARLSGLHSEALIEELKSIAAQVAVPVGTGARLEGMLVLGSKASGALFSQADHVFLSALCQRVAAAWENAQLFEKIEQAERLSVVGTLAASLAHEIRNPLSAVSNYVQMLPERHNQKEFLDLFMNSVMREIAKLTGLTDQLLAFGRPSQGMRVQVGLNAMAERANQLLRFQFLKKGVALVIQPCADCEIYTLGDESQLSQVALNLLINALQATDEGGTVTLTVSRSEPAWVEMKVMDTGSGMSPTQAARVFDAFFTTKSTGTGLGLAICRRVVSEHGGRIRLESREGEGTTFFVSLPAAENGMLVAS